MLKTPILPSGCYDVLPPMARLESAISSALLAVFEAHGYEQVSPPLLEYSDHLLAGRGERLSSQMFRVMDPTAHRVLGIRPDMTLQIARIATSSLRDAPRPLRLCYNGLILRLQGEQLKADRQLRQAGIELIGANSPEADAEVILVAAAALKKLGLKRFSIDLNLPSIAAAMVSNDALSPEQVHVLYEALSHKDVTTLKTLPLTYKESLIALVNLAGEAKSKLEAIEHLELPTSAKALCNNLRDVVQILSRQQDDSWTLTIDAAESQGHSYHSGVGFTIFVPSVAYEVGRGGRYNVGEESATGFTLYVETLRELVTPLSAAKRLLVADVISEAERLDLQSKGYTTLQSLPGSGSALEQAKQLQCAFLLEGGELKKV